MPPRWPHFFSDASWSSRCTPAAPAAIIDFVSSNTLSGPPKPASMSATIGANQSLPASFDAFDLIGTLKRVVDALDDFRHGVVRIQRLIGIDLTRRVRVRRDLPAREVDRLESGFHRFDRLAAGEASECGDRFVLASSARSFSAPRRASVYSMLHRSAQPGDVRGGVRAFGIDRAPRRRCVTVGMPVGRDVGISGTWSS